MGNLISGIQHFFIATFATVATVVMVSLPFHKPPTHPTPSLKQEVQVKVETPSPSPISTPIPTPMPQVKVNQIAPTPYDPIVDCIGPDGKHSQKTQKECDDFNAAWVKPQQANRNNIPNNQPNTVNCQTQSGWVRMSQDDCNKVNAEWANQLHEELNNQFKIHVYQDLEQEAKIDSTLDQLDNLRERIRHIQTSSPEEQNYANTLIKFIEARIKILQQQ